MIDPQSAPPIPHTKAPPETSAPATVLIVDDEPDMLLTLSFILEGEGGYRTVTAESGADALRLVRENSVEVALLDMHLPDMTGTDLLTSMKSLSPETVCIMTTGDTSFETVRDAVNAGASRYFKKPVDATDLLPAIRDLTEKQRMREEIRKLNVAQERTIQHLKLLQELSQVISSTLEVNEVLLQVRKAIINALGYSRCSIYLVDEESHTLRGRWGTDRDGNLLDLSPVEIPLDMDRPMAQVARGEIPFFLTESMEQHLRARDHHLLEEMRGVQAHAVLPLVAKGRIVGVLAVDNVNSGRPILREDIEDLLPFASQAAIAIENARLFKLRTESMLRETEKAADLQTLWHVARALSYELDLDRILGIIEDWVGSPQGDSLFSLFLYDRNFNDFEWHRGKGIDPDLAYGALFGGEDSLGHAAIEGGLKTREGLRGEPDTPLGRLAESAGIDAVMCIPLRVGDDPIGLIAVYSPHSGRFSGREKLLSTLASMAAPAIRNAQSYTKEKQIADTLQREILSPPPDWIGGYRFESMYEPALDEAKVGGDFYDVVELPDGRAAILLGDVSGKGLKAAVYTAMGKYMFRGLLMDDPSPGVLVGKLNAALYRYTEPGMFITLFYGLLDPKTGMMTYANAGHESPLHYMAEHDFSITLDTTGVVLGVDPDARYVEREVCLRKGDFLLLYTDGLTDARRGDEMLGIDGLQELFGETLRERPSSHVGRIYQSAKEYAEGFLHDDIALICVDAREGPEEPA